MKLIECRENLHKCVNFSIQGGDQVMDWKFPFIFYLSYLDDYPSHEMAHLLGVEHDGETGEELKSRPVHPSIDNPYYFASLLETRPESCSKIFLIFARNIYHQFQIFCKFAIIECLLDRTTTYLKGEFPVLAPAISWPPQSFRNTTNLVSAPPTR